ncbi:MAG: hypothetical protein QNJ22_12860 [Desulfosarcinaceae bacterium]|nr:hypothetical protein [Desulfosarcinaceae bacterium]
MSAHAGSPEPTVRVNVNVEIAAAALQTVVQNAKQIVGRDARGRYRVDTADMVATLITRFLAERDFTAYAADVDNYPRGEEL